MRSVRSYIARKKFLWAIENASEIKLNVGAGGTFYTGWISAEKDQFDVTNVRLFERDFDHGSIDRILAEHVMEHLEKEGFVSFLSGIKPFLKCGASVRIAVPDAFHPSGYIRELTKPGGLEPGAEDHKEFYTIDAFYDIARITGYSLTPVEYFNSVGRFIYEKDDWSRGYIRRSSKNYQGRFTCDAEEYKKFLNSTPVHLRQQFFDRNMSYTSLIADFVKSC